MYPIVKKNLKKEKRIRDQQLEHEFKDTEKKPTQVIA
jgi:hypothetical protein